MFTDINLPGDMDGAELARAVRALRPDLPVVYASGRHNAMTIAPLVSQSLFFSKPYNPNEVCGIIDQIAAH
jgi:DNA-binding LytR/AlgR family response regulator